MHHNHTQTTKPKRKWWQWVALVLMLLAIGTYVLTLDDSIQPQIEKPACGSAAPAVPGR